MGYSGPLEDVIDYKHFCVYSTDANLCGLCNIYQIPANKAPDRNSVSQLKISRKAITDQKKGRKRRKDNKFPVVVTLQSRQKTIFLIFSFIFHSLFNVFLRSNFAWFIVKFFYAFIILFLLRCVGFIISSRLFLVVASSFERSWEKLRDTKT